jgi:hypothetical protein
MDPRLLQQLIQAMQELAQSSPAAAAAMSSMADVLARSAGRSGQALDKLGRHANNLGSEFDDLSGGISPLKNAVFQLFKAAGQAVAGHLRFSASMLDLNRTIYETENVFSNMNSQLELGQTAIMDALTVISTAGRGLPIIGDLFGTTLEKTGEAALNLSKVFLQQLVTASNQVYDASKKVTSQYGLLTPNLDNFSKRAAAAGLSSGQFGRILSENAASLAVAFGNVSMGTKLVSDSMAALTKQDSVLMRQFRGLGMDIDDAAREIADYAALQTMTGQKISNNAEDQISATIGYIGNLKVLQAITGDDIKAQKQRQRELLQQAAFRAKYDQLIAAGQEHQAKKMLMAAQAAEKFGPAASKAFMEMSTSGQILTSESAQFATQFPAVIKLFQNFNSAIKDSSQAMPEFEKNMGVMMTAQDAAIKADQKRIAGTNLLVSQLASDSTFLSNLAKSFVDVSDFAGRLKNASSSVEEISKMFAESKDRLRTTLQDLGALGEFELKNFQRQQKQRMEFEGRVLKPDALSTVDNFLESMNSAQIALTDMYMGVAQEVTRLTLGFGQSIADFNAGVSNAGGRINSMIDGINSIFSNIRAQSPDKILSKIKDLEQDRAKILESNNSQSELQNQRLRDINRELATLKSRLDDINTHRGIAVDKPLPMRFDGAASPVIRAIRTQASSTVDPAGIAVGEGPYREMTTEFIKALDVLGDKPVGPMTVALDTANLEAIAAAMSNANNGVGTASPPADARSTADNEPLWARTLSQQLETMISTNRDLLREARRGNDISDKILRVTA